MGLGQVQIRVRVGVKVRVRVWVRVGVRVWVRVRVRVRVRARARASADPPVASLRGVPRATRLMPRCAPPPLPSAPPSARWHRLAPGQVLLAKAWGYTLYYLI